MTQITSFLTSTITFTTKIQRKSSIQIRLKTSENVRDGL